VDAIVAEGLEKRYGDVQALDGVSFRVRAGEVFGLLGPNGAGKSTTVKVLTTLTTPDAGHAEVAGHDLLREPNAVRRSIGYVPQSSGVDRDATGRENLMLQGRVQGMSGQRLRDRVQHLLELIGIADAADRVVRGYSGGMKRRLDVALGLVHGPQVLFLDEPTTGLDPEARAAMWEELDVLAREELLTILLTTHYLEEADALTDRLAIVSRGRVVVEGNAEELKGSLQGEAVVVELVDGVVVVDVLGVVVCVEVELVEVDVEVDVPQPRAELPPAAVKPVAHAIATATAIRIRRLIGVPPSLPGLIPRPAGRKPYDTAPRRG
jgi:ABC-2 type transport system ATP-binding protein